MRRREPEVSNNSPYAFEGAGAMNPSTLPQYNPKTWATIRRPVLLTLTLTLHLQRVGP